MILYRLQADNGLGPFHAGICYGFQYNHLAGPTHVGWNGKYYKYENISRRRKFAFTSLKTAIEIFEQDIPRLIDANFKLAVLEVDGRAVIKGPQDQAMFLIGREKIKDCLTLKEVVEKGLFKEK